MGYKPRDVYKGRRKYKVPLMIFFFVLAFLLVAGVGLFYGLQQFIVYDETGVRLQFTAPEAEESPEVTDAVIPTPDVSGMTVNIVYRDPDFSQVSFAVGEESGAAESALVSFRDASDPVRLETRLAELQEQGYTSFLFDLKTEEGQLAWASQASTALSFGTGGRMDYTDTIAALHEQGMRAAARISVCADNLLAVRNWPLGLRDAGGMPFADENGVFWLDPYNRQVRLYIIDLMTELAAQGFDEIVLDDLWHPDGDGFAYSITLHTEPSAEAAVGQLAVKLAEAAEGLGVELSVCLQGDSLRYDRAAESGQDPELFWRIFERLYCVTDAETAASDRDQALRFGGSAERFVPICPYQAPEGFDSYVLYTPEE